MLDLFASHRTIAYHADFFTGVVFPPSLKPLAWEANNVRNVFGLCGGISSLFYDVSFSNSAS